MSDLLKEFKMTDLLGMMMPGAFVVLLFGWEFGLWERMGSRTVFPKGEIFLSVAVLVAGYAVGMLIHELADWLEKCMWQEPIIDPRTLAVLTSGYVSKKKDKLKTLAELKEAYESICAKTVIIFVLLGAIAGLSIGGMGGGMCGAVMSLVVYAVLRCSMEKKQCELCEQIADELAKNKARVMDARQDNGVLSYRSQAHVYGSEEYERMVLRKRDLFDGFRTMARNIFLTVLLLGGYSSLTHDKLAGLRQNILERPTVLGLIVVVMVLLAVRFYHYTYLRYKYIYEDASERDDDPPCMCGEEGNKCPCAAKRF